MIETALKGVALLALASIAVGTVRWLLRHRVLLLAATALAVAAWLMH